MLPYTQYTPFSPYENVLSNFRFCNSHFFPITKQPLSETKLYFSTKTAISQNTAEGFAEPLT